MTHLTSYSKLL